MSEKTKAIIVLSIVIIYILLFCYLYIIQSIFALLIIVVSIFMIFADISNWVFKRSYNKMRRK